MAKYGQLLLCMLSQKIKIHCKSKGAFRGSTKKHFFNIVHKKKSMPSTKMSQFAIELYIVGFFFLAEWIILPGKRFVHISCMINKAYSLKFLLQTAKSSLYASESFCLVQIYIFWKSVGSFTEKYEVFQERRYWRAFFFLWQPLQSARPGIPEYSSHITFCSWCVFDDKV